MFNRIKEIWKSFKKLFLRNKRKGGVEASPQRTRGQPLFLTRISFYVLGQSLKTHSRRHPDIRVAKVGSFADAYRQLLRISDQHLLTYRYAGGHYYYTVTLPETYGRLVLTDHVSHCGNGVIAVMKVDVAELMPIVKEIRYILTQ